MKLKTLVKDLSDITVKGSKEVIITGINTNSRQICPGNIFVAKKGASYDGIDFIPLAVENGAVAIVTDIFHPFSKNITQIITDDIEGVLVKISSKFFQNPDKNLYMVGITGTNGKTTTSFLVKHLLNHLNYKTGLLGTNEYHIGDFIYPSTFTTPLVETTYKFLKEMIDQKCTAAVMEVSSHGLVQKRVEGIDFDVAIFTNLTNEHLDYHITMDNYAEAKKKLFQQLDSSTKKNKIAIINADSPWHTFMVKDMATPKLMFGIQNSCDVQAKNIEFSSTHTTFEVTYQGQSEQFITPLIGKFNIYNLLAAISLAVHLSCDLKMVSSIFASFKNIEGRMQSIEKKDRVFFVDFAHKPDALENCLKTLTDIKKAKIITVFGCGGNRDKKKRPQMAEIAEKYSDTVIVTSDNPRKEDPQQIVRDISSGFINKSLHLIELDRKKAIQKAFEISNKGDFILVAGKGHEKKQIFAHQTIDFDDMEVIKNM
ncbi:MAG: UDP-N-acetylmuramoyl-L-alanyl-D-glutamate--2,6-diaminopimelate ligase [Chlamydiota bacterium]